MTWMRRALSAILAMLAVLLLGTAAWAVPSPAPGAPGGAGVISWVCEPKATPVPTTWASPDGETTVPAPTTSPSPFGEACAATDYAAPPGPIVVSSLPPQPAPSPGQGSVIGAECQERSESYSSPSPTASPAASPYALRPGTVIGRDCPVYAELGRGQAFVMWLFLGSLLVLGLAAFLIRQGRAFRG